MELIDKLLDSWKDYSTPEILNQALIKLDSEYKTKKCFPEKKDVFLPFKLDQDKCQVVILGMSPYSNGKATGIPFANDGECGLNLSPSLQLIIDRVEEDFHPNLYLDFDISLKSWIDQGVLLLNASLTTIEKEASSHLYIWHEFFKYFFTQMSERKPGTIYCLWGYEAQQFEKYINKEQNHILKCKHPSYYVRNNQPFECDHFKKINDILMNNYNYKIKW